jgi:MraZ protein
VVKSGKNYLILPRISLDNYILRKMKSLIGEFPCTLDSKGRFLMPSALRKQLPEGEQMDFILNKGLDDCLILYPIKVWETEMQRIQSLNMYETKNRAFARVFLSGASEITLDTNGRGLISKHLMEKAFLEKDIVMIAQVDRIEIWDKQRYDQWLASSEVDIAQLAEEVMRNNQG